MRFTFLFVALIFSPGVNAQALRDINFNYLYNPEHPFKLDTRIQRTSDGWTAFYELSPRDTVSTPRGDYSINWQLRTDLSVKDGETVSEVTARKGTLQLPATATNQVLTAKVINSKLSLVWFYYYVLGEEYPVIIVPQTNGEALLSSFVPTSSTSVITADGPWVVSYYNDVFPAGAPGFSEGQARVSKTMQSDSIIQILGNNSFTYFNNGLYLFQKDTSSAEGFAIRAQDDYPRYTRIENLPGPWMYICTKQEFDRIENAKGEKKVFDRTVLSITGDAERAKKLIRNYFRRVELANTFFTSYKEGWKTDRGMIYIIFGMPDRAFRFHNREVWEYNNDLFTINFTFVRSASIFDPDNYVLIRDKKYKDTWYKVIDLWRNARF